MFGFSFYGGLPREQAVVCVKGVTSVERRVQLLQYQPHYHNQVSTDSSHLQSQKSSLNRLIPPPVTKEFTQQTHLTSSNKRVHLTDSSHFQSQKSSPNWLISPLITKEFT